MGAVRSQDGMSIPVLRIMWGNPALAHPIAIAVNLLGPAVELVGPGAQLYILFDGFHGGRTDLGAHIVRECRI